ncbi:MAG: adenylyl-sulfate kinase [Alphaproteobacteria bacterium]|nr:adenylyl-sulfate kinase [Alphaproteobacteria bacterium]MCB9697839.1 adenylyl-sulfate kinase [Alphaproteobacteria bacterium]
MSEPKSKNIHWHGAEVTRDEREEILGQKGCVVWFTGLSGSGKSTVSRRVEQKLLAEGVHTYVLDGDNVRHGLNRDLGFSPQDRNENIRRVGCVAQLFADAGTICLTAFISPYRADRDQARKANDEGRFVEVFVNTPLDVCEERDPKGLYKKARAGQIPEFTGISAPYEEPDAAELNLQTAGRSIDECADDVIAYLRTRGFIS